MNATEYCDDCMGAAATMEAVQYLLLGITLIVVLLVKPTGLFGKNIQEKV